MPKQTYIVRARQITPRFIVYDVINTTSNLIAASNANESASTNLARLLNDKDITTLEQWERLEYDIRIKFVYAFTQTRPNFKGQLPC